MNTLESSTYDCTYYCIHSGFVIVSYKIYFSIDYRVFFLKLYLMSLFGLYTDVLLNSLFKCSNISTLAFYFSTPSNENAVSIS